MTDELYHYGVKGMKWGVRRYQNDDGSYTDKGKARRRSGSWSPEEKTAVATAASLLGIYGVHKVLKRRYRQHRQERPYYIKDGKFVRKEPVENRVGSLSREQTREINRRLQAREKSKTSKFMKKHGAAVSAGLLGVGAGMTADSFGRINNLYNYRSKLQDNAGRYAEGLGEVGRRSTLGNVMGNFKKLNKAKFDADNAAHRAYKLANKKSAAKGALIGVGTGLAAYGLYKGGQYLMKKRRQKLREERKAVKHSERGNNMSYVYPDELYHYGVKGQRWGVRRYQNADGSLTDAGRSHYGQRYTGSGGRSGRVGSKRELTEYGKKMKSWQTAYGRGVSGISGGLIGLGTYGNLRTRGYSRRAAALAGVGSGLAAYGAGRLGNKVGEKLGMSLHDRLNSKYKYDKRGNYYKTSDERVGSVNKKRSGSKVDWGKVAKGAAVGAGVAGAAVGGALLARRLRRNPGTALSVVRRGYGNFRLPGPTGTGPIPGSFGRYARSASGSVRNAARNVYGKASGAARNVYGKVKNRVNNARRRTGMSRAVSTNVRSMNWYDRMKSQTPRYRGRSNVYTGEAARNIRRRFGRR